MSDDTRDGTPDAAPTSEDTATSTTTATPDHVIDALAAPAHDGTDGPDADVRSDEDGSATGEAQDSQAPEDELDPEERAALDGRSPGELLTALDAAEAQRETYLDALQRERAEFDNFRKRSAREAAGARAAGVGDLATQLLDVLDDLDRTVQVAEDSSDEGLAAGITAVRRKLVDALVAAGVTRIDETGVPFDATKHEAVQQMPADEPLAEPEVAEVLRPGYVHGERCLRPAMVAVRQ